MPSACCTRYSTSYSPRVWSACLIAPSRAVRSSGCTRSKVAAKSRRASGLRPNSERPRSVIHTSLPETSHTHMARFPASAARPIRFALSRNASFERLSSSMTTASSISGVAVTRRNSWSAVAFSAGVWARNGPCPRMVPQIAWNVMINIETLIPPRPKRSAAQMSRGIGAYKRAGEVLGPAGVLSNTKIPSATVHAPTRAASSTRRGDRALGRLTNRWCAPSRNAGTRTTVVTAFEIPRLRHSIQ